MSTVVEENPNYSNEGYYLHDNKCQIFQSKFVKKKFKDCGRKEVTIDIRHHAYKCEHQAKYGCMIIWCQHCYDEEVKND